jgi:chemotaxis protein histidine kinase CheA
MVGDRATAERERERAKRGREDRPDLKKDDRSAIPQPRETTAPRDTGGGSGGGGDSKQRSRDDYPPPPVGGGDKPQQQSDGNRAAASQNQPPDKSIPATREADSSGGAQVNKAQDTNPTGRPEVGGPSRGGGADTGDRPRLQLAFSADASLGKLAGDDNRLRPYSSNVEKTAAKNADSTPKDKMPMPSPGAPPGTEKREYGPPDPPGSGTKNETWEEGPPGPSEQKAPEQKAPEQKAPEQKAPEQKPPEQKAPEQKPPEQKAPEQKPPEQKAPEQKAPEQKPPEQKPPEQKPPEQKPPEQKPPEQKPPEQKPPEQKPPEQKAPEQKAPEQKAPEQKAPEQKAPEQKAPEQKAPEQKPPAGTEQVQQGNANQPVATPFVEAAAKSSDLAKVPPSEIGKVHSRPIEQGDRDLARRFENGTCTPQEAMYIWNKYMDTKIDTPPVWNPDAHLWVAPGGPPGAGAGVGPGGAGTGGAPGGGSSADSGGGIPSGTGAGDSVQGGRPGVRHDGTAGETGSHTGRGNAGETGFDLGIFLRLLGGLLEIEAKRMLDIGEARKGFIAGATGLPLEPPTDPHGRAEWERGERVAMIIAIIDLLTDGGLLPRGPGGGSHPPQFAPSTAGGGAGGQLGPGGGYHGAPPVRPQAAAGGLETTGAGRPAAKTSEPAGTLTDKPPEKTPEKAPEKAPDNAPTEIPRGMSRNEMREADSRAKYFPNAREPVAKQPGVDWVGGKPTESWRQEGNHVTQTLSGGTWIQGKRLADEAMTPLDQRVRGAVDQAAKKFYDPVRTGVSSRSTTMSDGTQNTKFTTTLTNPEGLLVHIEVPNLNQMSQAEQVLLQTEAQQALNRWTDGGNGKTYEGVPIRVQVVEAPPPR